MEASAGVLATVVKGELEQHEMLVHAALRLLATFADDPLCNRAFCHSGEWLSALQAWLRRACCGGRLWHIPCALSRSYYGSQQRITSPTVANVT